MYLKLNLVGFSGTSVGALENRDGIIQCKEVYLITEFYPSVVSRYRLDILRDDDDDISFSSADLSDKQLITATVLSETGRILAVYELSQSSGRTKRDIHRKIPTDSDAKELIEEEDIV